jgi:hypothetical protein
MSQFPVTAFGRAWSRRSALIKYHDAIVGPNNYSGQIVKSRNAIRTTLPFILRNASLSSKRWAAKFQFVLVKLINGSNWIVQIRCPCLLNVIAEKMRHNLSLSEINQPLNAEGKRGWVFHVESPRIQCVPCEENASLTVVDGNRGSLMARNRNGIEDPAPQVIDRHLRGPVPKTKERLNRDCLRLHNSGVWAGFELRIARNVIIMCMSVSYDQGDTLAIVPFQPLINLIHYDPSHVGFTCARIQ